MSQIAVFFKIVVMFFDHAAFFISTSFRSVVRLVTESQYLGPLLFRQFVRRLRALRLRALILANLADFLGPALKGAQTEARLFAGPALPGAR